LSLAQQPAAWRPADGRQADGRQAASPGILAQAAQGEWLAQSLAWLVLAQQVLPAKQARDALVALAQARLVSVLAQTV
jgi:hypothetical protein